MEDQTLRISHATLLNGDVVEVELSDGSTRLITLDQIVGLPPLLLEPEEDEVG